MPSTKRKAATKRAPAAAKPFDIHAHRFVTVSEVATYFRISDWCVRTWINRKYITAHHFGGNVRIPITEVTRIETEGRDLFTKRTA